MTDNKIQVREIAQIMTRPRLFINRIGSLFHDVTDTIRNRTMPLTFFHDVNDTIACV